MKDRVVEAQKAMERAVREHKELNERLEREFAEKDQRLRASLRSQMDKLIEEQIAEIQAMQGEFGEASSLMDQKYRDLNQKFVELQAMYEGRPSRPEDKELIAKLQEEILAREADLKKAAEDMKFYKLELINREHTFNNMFGNNPSVGLMNPMQAAKKVGTLPPAGMMSQKAIPQKRAI